MEGIPGSGKTTLLRALRRVFPAARLVPELVEPAQGVADVAFFVANDRRKEHLVRSGPPALLDRYWPSTAAYALALDRLRGRPTGPADVVERLFGETPSDPGGYVFLDAPRALRRPYAVDGHFADAEFRNLLRSAYFDLFAAGRAPVLLLSDSDTATDTTIAFVARHLDLSQEGATPWPVPVSLPS